MSGTKRGVKTSSNPPEREPLVGAEANVDYARILTERYTAVSFHERELNMLWSNVWQVVCREDEVPGPGDFQEYSIGNRSYIVVRGQDGVVRGFHNVCLHRGNLLKYGCGNTGKEIVCTFHAWAYNLDGSLKRVTDRKTFAPIRDEDYGLRAVAVDVWAGWVFLHPNPETAEPLLEFLSPVTEVAAPYQLQHLVPVGMNIQTRVSANWKVGVEGFLETYHFHALHPQILPMTEDLVVPHQEWGRHSMMCSRLCTPSSRLGPEETVDPAEILEAMFGVSVSDSYTDGPATRAMTSSGRRVVHRMGEPDRVLDPLKYFEQYRDSHGDITLPEGVTVRDVLQDFFVESANSKGVDFSSLTTEQMIDVWQFFVFPNLVINVTLGQVLVHRFLPVPGDPNSCTWDMTQYDWVADPELAKQLRTPRRFIPEGSESLGLVLDQDVENMPRIQRGLRSDSLKYVTLSSQEERLAHFNAVLNEWLQIGVAHQ